MNFKPNFRSKLFIMTTTKFSISRDEIESALIPKYEEMELRRERIKTKVEYSVVTTSRFSIKNLSESIVWFIHNGLEDLNPDLYDYFQKKGENHGCGKDNLYVLFGKSDPVRKLTKELVNLFCYYLFSHPYIECVVNGFIPESPDDLANFKQLQSYFESKNRKLRHLQSTIEDTKNRLKITQCTWEEIEHLKLQYPELDAYIEFDLEKVKVRFENNKNIFRGLRDTITNKLVGFYILYPIAKNLVALLESGKMQSAECFENNDIVNNINSAHALYVSTVWSSKEHFKSRAILFDDLFKECFYLLYNHKHLTGIYTKPRTDLGKILADRYQFNKLKEDSLIQFLSKEEATASISHTL